MESQIGCKANGLGTNILFKDGIPRIETMDTLLRSIEEQLGDSNRQIETCVKSILEMGNGMQSSDMQKFYHPGEAVTNIKERQLLEKTACYDSQPESITKLLNHIIETLKKNPGSEETVLQQLLQLSSQEGLCLPIHLATTGSMELSVMSINTAVNDSESINEVLWNDICMKLRRYFVDKLQNLPNSPVTPEINIMNQKRLGYLHSLCCLYPGKEIWGKYRSIRSQQFGAQLLTYGVSSMSSTENINFIKGVHHFERLVLVAQAMMQEDFSILNSGVFGNVVTTIEALNEIYLDKLSDEIGAITDSLHSELTNGTVKTFAKKSKDVDSKAFPKSASEAASLSQFRGGLRKQQSKSLDSLLSREDNFTDLQSLSADIIGTLIRFINCVLNIDANVQHLRSLMTWEISSAAQKKTNPKRLKSALKGRRDQENRLQSKNRPLYITGDMESSGLSLPANVTNKAMMAEMTASLRVVERQASETKLWDWHSVFTKVSADVAKCLEQKIVAVSEQILEIDKSCLEKKRTFEMISVSDNLTGGRLDYPAKVSQGIGEFFEEMDLLLVFAKAFLEGSLEIVCSAFVDCFSTTIKNIYVEMNKILSDMKYGICVWFQCLANVAFIRNHLLYYETVLNTEDNGNSKKTLNGLYKQYCELAEQLSKQVIEHQQCILSTSILQDAESHNWEDSKDFYEDERCSFDIHMWYLHMKGLQYDLWNCCSPMAAQNIYIVTLKESLSMCEQRYSRVKPSYKRTQQVKYDITTILLCTFELLMPGCVHLGMFLDPNTNQKPVYSIHNSCCTLLSVLAVVTSPLEAFYKIFKKGFKKRHSRSAEGQVKMHLSHWISWIYPDLFMPGKDNPEDLQTTTALYLQLKILLSQPGHNFGLFLESLIMKDYTLPIMLLTQSAKYSNSGSSHEEATRSPNSETTDELESTVLQIFTDFFDIFALLHEMPESLSKVMLPVFERTDTWYLLDNTTSLGRSHPVPAWIKVILNCFQKFIKRSIEPGIKVFLEKAEHSSRDDVESVTSFFQGLPCGCHFTNLKSADTPRKTTGTDDLVGFSFQEENTQVAEHKEVMAEAMYSVITQMNDDVYMLPTPLIMFLKALQDQVNQKGLHSPHDCVAIKLLATALRTCLIDTEMIEGWLGLSLVEEIKDNLRMLGECTYHVLTASSCGKSSGVPRMATLFMKANRNWLSEQIELLSDHFSNDIFELPDNPRSLHGITEDFTEQLMISVLSHIQNADNGLEKLKNCYYLVEHNFDWITGQLDIPQILGTKDNPRNTLFNLSTARMEEECFNPLVKYAQIGNAVFDQDAIVNFEYNWNSLLQSDLGLSEVGMKNLLLHRHEMQDGAYLEESEKKPVEVLKKKFDYECSDLV